MFLSKVVFPTAFIFWCIAVACLLPFGLLVVRASTEDGLRAFIAPDCAPPCVMGIHPGRTTAEEALGILTAHPWVNEILPLRNAAGTITTLVWRWNGQQPAFIDAARDGVVTSNFTGTAITSVFVSTNIALGDLWNALGEPEKVTMFGRLDGHFAYLGSYERLSLHTSGTSNCPMTPHGFWHTRIETLLWLWPFKPADEFYDSGDPYKPRSCLPYMFSGGES